MTVLVIDKPVGPTSFEVVRKVGKLLRRHREVGGDSPDPRKIGHGGTLDPLASGVLPICVGEGTKVAGFLLDADKRYEAVVQLGVATETLDAEGQVTERAPVPPLTEGKVREVLAAFTGPLLQTPPMYSALKKQGRPLHEYARAGQDVEREARQLTIFELSLLGLGDGAIGETALAPGQIQLFVHCSKGTYVRVLAADIARSLGTVGHLAALRRVSSGPFHLEQALTMEELIERVADPAPLPFVSCAEALAHMPALAPGPAFLQDLVLGRRLSWEDLLQECPEAAAGPLRLLDEASQLVAVVDKRADGRLDVRRVFRR